MRLDSFHCIRELNTKRAILRKYSNTSVFVDFGYRRFLPQKNLSRFSSFARISSACPNDLGANFAKTNDGGASSEKSGTEGVLSEPKDYVEAEGFIPSKSTSVIKLVFFGKKMPKRKRHCQDTSL
ncbi:hypothetical protein AVEN_138849-1 [Araneus ventricosus]|uniref:Uncharacterized protein n=1 Tax=Araneus ventricosus TaxID=182803 RepID=A0A4Y2G8N3_ARAVE|nr:hypothetical protein AVEN_138849-1 [Araneus ventricosus]